MIFNSDLRRTPTGTKRRLSTTFSVSSPVARGLRPAVRSQTPATNTPSVSFLEGFSKIAPSLITALSLLAGLWQFQQQQTFSELQEFKRKMWDKRLSAYTSLADVTSQLMISNGGSDFDSLSQRFQRLCYSSSPLFDSVAVEDMEKFDEEVKSVLNGEGGDKSILRERGRLMLRSCQSSIDSDYRQASHGNSPVSIWLRVKKLWRSNEPE